MKIAVTYENGNIFGHFGHTQQFKLYDVQDGKVVASLVVDTMGSGHGALAGFLAAHGVDTLICGGIGGGAQAALAQAGVELVAGALGGGAQMALANAGIRLYGGVTGSADAAVQALLDGRLAFDPDVHCDHHDHHGEGHSCGSHEGGCHSHEGCHGHDGSCG